MRELSPYVLQPAQSPMPDIPTGFHEPIVEEGTHLRDYWRVLRKHQRLILSCAVGVVALTAAVVFIMTPQYTAETTILIERKAPQALKIEGAQAEAVGPDEYDYYKTQYEILRSKELASRVILEQKLDQHPLFRDEEKPGVLQRMLIPIESRFGHAAQTTSTRTGKKSVISTEVLNAYIESLAIRPFPRTRLVKVAFTSPDPTLSARIVSAHAAFYARYGVELRTQANVEAQHFLEEKLIELKERVEQSEMVLNTYRRDKGILSLDEKENIVVDRLSDLNKRLTEAEAERIGLEAQVRLIRKRAYTSLPAVIDNPLIQTLKEQLAPMEAEQSQLAVRFKDDYPKLVQLKAQIAGTKERINAEIARVVAGIETAYLAADGKEQSLREKMEEQKAATLGLKDASVNYAILAREVDTNRQLYDSVLQRMKEMGVAAELRASNVSVVDKAVPPEFPSYPRRGLALTLSVLVGLGGGLGVAFFLEYMDNTVKTPEEVQQYLGLPSLGVVPEFASLVHAPGVDGKPDSEERDTKSQVGSTQSVSRALALSSRMELVLSHHPLSVIAEAYRTLRTALFLSRAGEAPRTLLFTSATEGEGKTLTTVNTAVIFAQMGLRVLVIDADLRRPRCHKVLGVRNWAGLTEALTGHRDVREVIKATTTENLFLLPSGAIPPNPAELVGSRKMQELVATLLQRFDCLIVDTPPIMPVSDALLMSRLVDGVVLVVNGQKTPRHIVKEARSRLVYARAKILGVVLNRVDMVQGDYAYYYGHYSSYYRQSEPEDDRGSGRNDDHPEDQGEKLSA
ncbi:MAG: GumC family protein [Candidatus Binatia bacterium]